MPKNTGSAELETTNFHFHLKVDFAVIMTRPEQAIHSQRGHLLSDACGKKGQFDSRLEL